MTFLCVFLCPFFEAKPQQILHQNRILEPQKVYAPQGGGGGTLNFYTYVGSGYFFGVKILNFNIFWGVSKNRYFWGIKISWIFIGVTTKLACI